MSDVTARSDSCFPRFSQRQCLSSEVGSAKAASATRRYGKYIHISNKPIIVSALIDAELVPGSWLFNGGPALAALFPLFLGLEVNPW